jgi:hypothetical protein
MAAGSCRCYQGLIYMGVHKGAHPCWPWSTGVQGGGGGGCKKSNSEIWHNFQGFSFFEVKLKLIIQSP